MTKRTLPRFSGANGPTNFMLYLSANRELDEGFDLVVLDGYIKVLYQVQQCGEINGRVFLGLIGEHTEAAPGSTQAERRWHRITKQRLLACEMWLSWEMTSSPPHFRLMETSSWLMLLQELRRMK